MNLAAIAAGTVLVAVVLSDAIATLVTTQHHTGRWWPTTVFYRVSWRGARWVVRRPRSQKVRDRLLNTFGPLSLIALLVVWVLLAIAGWGLVWWGLRDEFGGAGVEGYLDGLYYAGIGFLTVGFGDIVPAGDTARMLTIAEALMGLGVVALVIGYLPSLWSAYAERERPIAGLDTLEGGVTGAAEFLDRFAGGNGLAGLDADLVEWERWCASLDDMHQAYPMLMFFRSRVPGQSWVAALAIVTESAAFVTACVESEPGPQARRLLRRSLLTLDRFVGVERPEPEGTPEAMRPSFRAAYHELEREGLALRPEHQAWQDMVQLRRSYGPTLEALAETFLVPLEFHNSGPVPGL